jgi:hypothetical protein
VIFDNGSRIMLATSFETDWDPYIDDAVTIIGVDYFIDWLKHTVEAEASHDALQETVTAAREGRAATAPLKALLQSAQVPASAFYDVLSEQTVPQIRKAQRVQRAFEQVLDNPSAAQALQNPALQPLLAEAAD